MSIYDYMPETVITYSKDKGSITEKIPAKKKISDDIKNLVQGLLGLNRQPQQNIAKNIEPIVSQDPEQIVRKETPIQNIQPTVEPTPTVILQFTTARNPAVSKFKIPENVHSAIKKASDEFGVPASILYDIALQESSFDPTLRNPDPNSTAGGLFQYTNGTWDTINNYANMPNSSLTNWNNPDKMDPEASARATAYLIKNGQLGRWNASQGVWGPQYTQDEMKNYYSQTAPKDIPSMNWKQ